MWVRKNGEISLSPNMANNKKVKLFVSILLNFILSLRVKDLHGFARLLLCLYCPGRKGHERMKILKSIILLRLQDSWGCLRSCPYQSTITFPNTQKRHHFPWQELGLLTDTFKKIPSRGRSSPKGRGNLGTAQASLMGCIAISSKMLQWNTI